MCLTRCCAGQHSSNRRHANEDAECVTPLAAAVGGIGAETAADLHGGDDFLGRMHGRQQLMRYILPESKGGSKKKKNLTNEWVPRRAHRSAS